MSNNTLSTYIEKEDTLYTRMTKFANPNNWSDKRREPLLNNIKQALIDANYNALTILLGTKSVPILDKEMMVFDIQDYNFKPLEDFANDGYKISRVNYSIDVDTSRIFTITPTFELTKTQTVLEPGIQPHIKKQQYIYIDKQIEIPANGSGVYGEMNDIYVNILNKQITKHYKNIKHTDLKFVIISVDDKRKWFLNELRKRD